MRRTARAMVRAVILIPLFLVVGAPRTCGECNVTVNTDFDEQAFVMDEVVIQRGGESGHLQGTAVLTPVGEDLFRSGAAELSFTVDVDRAGAFTGTGTYDFGGQVAVDDTQRDMVGHGSMRFGGQGGFNPGAELLAEGRLIESPTTR